MWHTHPAVKFCWWPNINFQNELVNCVNVTEKEPFFPMNIIQALRCQRDLISLSSLLQHLSHGLSSWQEPGSPMGKPLFPSITREIPDEMMIQQLAMWGRLYHLHSPGAPLPLISSAWPFLPLPLPLLWAGYLTMWVISGIIFKHHYSRRGAGDMCKLCGWDVSCLSG